MMIPVSFSENLEDLILNVFFYNINSGFYIDIGSFKEKETSVTKYFYKKGWNGINIKPIKEEYEKLIKERYNDISLDYYNGGLFDNKFDNQNDKTIITAYKMSEICKTYIPTNKQIHFCKIEVDGDERKVLLGFDLLNYRPKIFCIEEYEPNYQSYEYILINNGYSLIYQYKNNKYYLNNKEKDLKERSDYIDGIIQIYKNNNSV